MAYWLLPTLDFHIPAHVDASSTVRVISRDTADFVMAHNTRATDRVSPSSTVGAEEPSGDQETSPDTQDFVHLARPKIPDLCSLYPGQCVPGYHYHHSDGRLKALRHVHVHTLLDSDC